MKDIEIQREKICSGILKQSPDVFGYLPDQKIKDITINILHRPTPIDAKNYPTEKKTDIIQKLENCLETLSKKTALNQYFC